MKPIKRFFLTSLILIPGMLISAYKSEAQKVAVFYEGGKSGLKNSDGEVILKPIYHFIGGFSDTATASELAMIEIGESIDIGLKFGFINQAGKIVIPLVYDRAMDFKEGLAPVALGNYDIGFKYGFINKTGKVIIPIKYNDINSFSEGMAKAGMDNGKTGNKYGYIDKMGKVIIPMKYDKAFDFHEGLAEVEIGNNETGFKCGFINKTGKIIIPVIYTLHNEDFKNGKIKVSLNERTFYIDKNGNEVTE